MWTMPKAEVRSLVIIKESKINFTVYEIIKWLSAKFQITHVAVIMFPLDRSTALEVLGPRTNLSSSIPQCSHLPNGNTGFKQSNFIRVL